MEKFSLLLLSGSGKHVLTTRSFVLENLTHYLETGEKNEWLTSSSKEEEEEIFLVMGYAGNGKAVWICNDPEANNWFLFLFLILFLFFNEMQFNSLQSS